MEKSKKSKLSDPKLILDRYTVLEKLGEGTYGKVYKVFDEKSGQVGATPIISRYLQSRP